MSKETELMRLQNAIDHAECSLRYLKSQEKELREEIKFGGLKPVLVQFAGCPNKYAYNVRGHVRIGDYVRAHSNNTRRKELVKVVAMGNGGYTGKLKEAELLSE